MTALLRRRDFSFLLYDVFGADALASTTTFAGQDRAMYDAVLDTAEKVAADAFAPCAAELDANEPTWDGERVTLPASLKAALRAFYDAGFGGASFAEELGGMHLPYSVTQAASSMFAIANTSASAYLMLTTATAHLLQAFANDALKQRFLPPLLDGRYFGTMCLSETQAGSSLADIKTTATPHDDGTYRLIGDKMWISGGEHELSDNIVHLVLARTPDAPAGIKGISLFLVPRFHVDDDGAIGAANDVKLVGLNHKMGYRGTVNTVLRFGDQEQCVGFLVGELHQGLRCMFHMMNEARISVGVGASMLGYAGFLTSLQYAQERQQGRPLGAKDPTSPQVPLVDHVDVRRMLLAQKAYVEGGMALSFMCARLVDDIACDVDVDDNKLLLDVLTPIAKAWPSHYALKANDLAIQVLGGYGYTREFPVERMYRDNRLNPIHEGTNGIQALDLLGRKVPSQHGRGLQLLGMRMQADINLGAKHDDTQRFAAALQDEMQRFTETTMGLLGTAQGGDIDGFLQNAHAYLHYAGHLVVAWLWLKQANALVDGEAARDDFAHGKLAACSFFFDRELPRCERWARLLREGEDSARRCAAEWL